MTSEANRQRWGVEMYELHDYYDHGQATATESAQRARAQGRAPFTVRTRPRGPAAVMLERALALNGLLEWAYADDSGDAPGATLEWVATLVEHDGKVRTPDSLHGSPDWPLRADDIRVHVAWHHRGETIEEELPTDLALTQERCKHARDAHPVVTARSRMKRELLTRLVLAAATAADGEDPDAEELAEERQAAAAAAELALGGRDGRLAAVERLVLERVLPCLPVATGHGEAVGVRLYETAERPATACFYERGGEWSAPPGADRERTAERQNRLRYEDGPFRDHRGVIVGHAVERHTTAWHRWMENASGERLWDPGSTIEGRLRALRTTERETVEAEQAPDATHVVTWRAKTMPASGAVHLLTAAEAERVRERSTGRLIEAAIDEERSRPQLEDDHPLRKLVAEHAAREAVPAG